MSEWIEIKLSEVITDIAAGPFGSNLKVDCFVEKGFPIIDGANLKGFKVTDNVTKFVTKEKAYSLHRSIARRGDIVVTISGTLGQISYIPENSEYPEYLCSQRQFRATFDQSKVCIPYLVYYFHSYEGQHKILSFANQVGVPALSQPLKNFREIRLSLPPLAEQQRIAGILSSLDDKIELNNQINDNLEKQAQALFKNWFIDYAPFGGIIPEDWKEGKLSDLGTIVAGGTPSKSNEEYYTNEGIAWITPKDLSLRPNKFTSKGEIDITQEGYDNSSAKLMPKGTVLFSSRAPIGYITIAQNDVCTNQGFKSVVPKKNVGTPYIYFYLKTHTEEIENKSSGSTFKEASGSLMNSLDAIIPSDEILAKFNALCNPIFDQQEVLEMENQHLTTLRDTLLPKLMSDEIDVEKVQI